MLGLSQFLERYKNFTPPARAMSRAISAAVHEILSISLSENQIRVARGVAHISLGGIQKSEIVLHKKEILQSARTKAGDSLRDIQ